MSTVHLGRGGDVRMLLLRLMGLFCLAVLSGLAQTNVAQTKVAQTNAEPPNAAPKKPIVATIPIRPIVFLNTKPVLGLPEISPSQGFCSSDGDTFFNTYHPGSDASGSQTGADIYSVSRTGEVKHLLRKLPVDFTDVALLDFFPSEHHLVTLLVAEKWVDEKRDRQPQERAYFLSLSDRDGAGAELVRLDLKFRPVRVAQFGSDDFLIFGWESVNNLPIIAVVKPDGTPRRFVDSDDTRATGLSLKDVQAARFLPFGDDVLLQYPRTTKPLRIMRASGQERVISLAIPAGYVLDTVLVPSANPYSLVVRVIEKKDNQTDNEKIDATQRQRLFEFPVQTGSPIAEYTFKQVKPENVTCAARSSLTALFMEDYGDGPTASDGTKPKRLVVDTARR